MMARFLKYAEKVYQIGEKIAELTDARRQAQIPTPAVWTSAFFMAATHLGSLNAMEEELRKPKRLDGLVGPRSRIDPIIKAAKTIKEHWDGVLRWFTSRISNGVVEAINGLIQSAKARARGFRSSRCLITIVYLIAGKLDFELPAVGHATHTK